MEIPSFFAQVETCLVTCLSSYLKKQFPTITFNTTDVRKLLKRLRKESQNRNSVLKASFSGIIAADFGHIVEVFDRYVHKGLFVAQKFINETRKNRMVCR